MSDGLEPDYAQLSDIPHWVSQSRDLIHRRWMLFGSLSALYVLISWLTADMGLLSLVFGLLITQFFLIVMIIAAKAADESQPMAGFALLELFKRLVLQLLIIAIAGTALILISLFVGSFFVEHLPAIEPSESGLTQIIEWINPGVMRFFYLYCVITMTAMWFLFPLMVFHALPLQESVKLGIWGWKRNEIVIMLLSYTPMLSLVILLLISEVAMILCLAFLPFYSALLYVSYRHIYRQQKSNSPAKALTEFVDVSA